MNILDIVFLNSVFILFPLFAYFLFTASQKSLGKETSEILFDLALYTSLYFLFKFYPSYLSVKVMFVTIPLIICYLKDKRFVIVILSIIISIYYANTYHIGLIYLVFEFLLYYIVVKYLKIKKVNDVIIISAFVIIKIIFMIIELPNIIVDGTKILEKLIILPLTFYFTTLMIYYLMKKSEEIISLHMTMKELEKQKQLRDSLFKISHEIKNPIAVCKGYLDMFDVDNKDHARRYIPIIKQEIERTLTLMNDFMMLTKIKVEKKKMDISVLLQDVCEMSEFMFKSEKIDFSYSIFDEEVYINGDYDRLKQVFINIVKNAIESIPSDRKGKIDLTAKFGNKRLNINIIINDNGIGMDKKTLLKIGEPFYTTKKNGTGLGVRFSKEIIEAHDGTIEYKSKPNFGTTVIVTLSLKNP